MGSDPITAWNRRAYDAKYDALLLGYQRQEATMKKVAAALREWEDVAEVDSIQRSAYLADLLDPIEPVSEADAADQFSQDCERRKP